MKRVLVVGSSGMVARALLERLATEPQAWEVHGLHLPELDLADSASIERALNEVRPKVVFNCAAFTNVDACESEPEKADTINGTGPGLMARWCAANGARLVHLSTDYVFPGTASAPILEDAPTGPVSAYGRSKLRGEQLISEAGGDWLIVRTAWVYAAWGTNFMRFVLDGLGRGDELRIVADQVGSPTYAVDLADALVRLVQAEARGIMHFVNTGTCTWLEFAEFLRAGAGLPGEFTPVTDAQLNRPAHRPSYSVLSTERYRSLIGTAPRMWQDAARDALERWRQTREKASRGL